MSNTKDYGRYTLLKKLATGGMAEVFLARQKGLEGFEKLCVIKRILPHLADDAEFVTMFLNEARIAARFNHPNICTIFDLGKEEGTYFIAMEYIHGEDLGRIMRQAWHAGTWLPVPITLRIIAGACEGLHYAHSKTDERGVPLRVVHRDVSPQNVLVAFEGNAKIVDFGIARAADQVSTTRSGSIKGKFAYMSPEQASGKALDHRSDQFAIGLVLYELLTGVRPLKRESDILTLKAAVDCEIPPPSQVAEVPPAFDAIAMRALAKMPEDRYPDTRSFQLAIDSFITQQGWTVSGAHVTEFMQQLFTDRLQREAETGEPQVSESQVNAVPASGSFPMPKRMPTRPEFMVAGADGPPPLKPLPITGEAPPVADGEPAPERRQVRPSGVSPAAARRNTAERPVTSPGRRNQTGLRPAAPHDPGGATSARIEPEVPRRRTASAVRKAAVVPAPEPEPEPVEPDPEPVPARPARRNSGQVPAVRTQSGEKKKSVLYMDEAEVAEQDAERRRAAKQQSFLDDDDDEETRAQPQRERRPWPRWPLALLAVGALAALWTVPKVRQQVSGFLHQVSAGHDDFAEANLTSLFLESNVPVEVSLGTKRIGTTPLEGVPVPEGKVSLNLTAVNLGIERTIHLQAKGSTLRHKEQFALGRVRFRCDKDCEVFISGRRVARANGPPLDYYEGTYDTECRNESMGLVGKAKATISKDRSKVAEVSFRLQPMEKDPK